MNSNRSSDRDAVVTARFGGGVRRAAAFAAATAVVALLAGGVGVVAAQDGGASGGDTTTLLLYVGIGVIALVLAFAAVLYLRRALAPETEDPLGR